MVEKTLEKVLIIEDDIDFEPNFNENMIDALFEVEGIDRNWDLV